MVGVLVPITDIWGKSLDDGVVRGFNRSLVLSLLVMGCEANVFRTFGFLQVPQVWDLTGALVHQH